MAQRKLHFKNFDSIYKSKVNHLFDASFNDSNCNINSELE